MTSRDPVAEVPAAAVPRRGANSTFERLSSRVTVWVGTSGALIGAALLVVAWLVTGPLCGFSNTWQLVMNTVSSVVTFLMVFLIQRSQNKDALALHLKLNELVKAQQGASNRLIDVERLSEEELRALHQRYEHLADLLSRSQAPRAPVPPVDPQVIVGAEPTAALPDIHEAVPIPGTSPSAPVQPAPPSEGMSRPRSAPDHAPRRS